MTNKIMNAIYAVGDNIKQNVAIYSAAGLMAVATSCGNSKTVEFDGNIGKDYFVAESKPGKSKSAGTNFRIDQYVNGANGGDGDLIRYFDRNNDGVLDNVRINPYGEDRQLYTKGAVFDAAQKMYEHLRDTMPQINLAAGKKANDAKEASDAATIDKYFK
ncbi:MAG: hypothetical protein ACP5N2_00510 [Candidatus Nanoarchaeia archaeon]